MIETIALIGGFLWGCYVVYHLWLDIKSCSKDNPPDVEYIFLGVILLGFLFLTQPTLYLLFWHGVFTLSFNYYKSRNERG